MTEPTPDLDPVEVLAEEFAERWRRGERPAVAEYADRHPELAEQIRELFPALVVLEELGPDGPTPTAPAAGPAAGTARMPERLGDFRLVREVGRGGMGVVYEAVQEALGRRVALKVLPADRLEYLGFRERFRQEAQAAARLRHPNIVPVHEVGEENGVPFFAMQFIDGRGLDQVLRERQGPRRPSGPASPGLPVRSEAEYFHSVARIGVQVAEALEHAHRAGVLHRDVKPSNLLLDEQGTVWVTDFGLAKVAGADGPTETGQVVGTLRYLAPERFRGWADPRSDVYGLGATLYELLTLQPAFDDAGRAPLVERILYGEPPGPRRLDPRIPLDLETVVLKAMAREPGDRYPTAEALADDLRRFLADRPVLARRSSALERGWRWCRRNPVVAGLAAAVAASLLAGTAVSLGLAHYAWQQAGEARSSEALATTRKTEAENSAQLAQARLEESKRQLYVSDLRLVQRAWEENQPDHFRELLARHRPERAEDGDLRGFEWYYWHRLCHLDLPTFRSQPTAVWGLAFSPDGKRLAAAASEDRTVRVWDVARAQEVLVLTGHTAPVWCVAFSPDGKFLASGSGSTQGEVILWDADTGRAVYTLRDGVGSVRAVAFSPDGKLLASAESSQGVHLWDVATGRQLRSFGHTKSVSSVAFSPDGKYLASGCTSRSSPKPSRGEVILWEADSGRAVHTLREGVAGVTAVAFSPDGKRLAAVGENAMVKLWDPATGKELPAPKERYAQVDEKPAVEVRLSGNTVQAVAFSPDGRRLATAGEDRAVRVWDVADGRETLLLRGHTATVQGLAFSPDGRRLASGSWDHTVKLWDATREPLVLNAGGAVFCLAFSPDGTRLAGGAPTPKLWDAASGQETLRLLGNLHTALCLAFSRDGTRLASVGGDRRVARVWDAADGRELLTLREHESVTSVAFDPGGTRLVTAGDDRTVRVWDAATGRQLLLLQSPDKVAEVAFSPDGTWIVTAGREGALKVWDAAGGEELRTLPGHGGVANAVAFSPDGRRIASGGQDKAVTVWDAATGEELLTLRGHTGPVTDVNFSPDGRRLVSSSWDTTAKLWDAATGQELLTFKGHTNAITQATFSPDGRCVATGSHDQTVRIWDATPPAE